MCLAVLAYGQTEPQRQLEQQRRTITGTVVNAVSGEPVRRALVNAYGQSSEAVLTGPDGRFEMEDVPDGVINFNVTKPGYFDPSQIAGSEWVERPAYSVGAESTDFTLKLSPGARVTGQVTNSEGDPVSRLQVLAFVSALDRGRRQWRSAGQAMTDDDGDYTFQALPPGSYVVGVYGRVRSPERWDAEPDVIPPMYYPGASDVLSAQRIEVQAGQEFQADMRVRHVRGYKVTGSVIGAGSVQNVSLTLEDADGQNALFDAIQFDPKRAQFTIRGLPEGSWTLRASGFSAGGRGVAQDFYESDQAINVAGADISNMQIYLHRLGPIPVTLNQAEEQPQLNRPEGVLEGQPPISSPPVRVTLDPVDNSNQQPWLNIGQVSPDGKPMPLQFQNVRPGKYSLSVQSFGPQCLDSAWSGDSDLRREYLTVASGSEPQPITINLRSDCAKLDATLDSSETHQSGFLVVVPAGVGRPYVSQIGKAGANGTFILVGDVSNTGTLTLSPGTYELYAFTSLDGVEYTNPKVLQQFNGQTVSLDANQKLQVNLTLEDPKGTQ